VAKRLHHERLSAAPVGVRLDKKMPAAARTEEIRPRAFCAC
jgi:hypothetical protein